MKTIEDMTTQIRKMDATAKSNTVLISKLKKKLGSFYNGILSCRLEYYFLRNEVFYDSAIFFLDTLYQRVKSQHGTENNVTSNVDEDKKQLNKPPVKTGKVNLYMW